MADKRESSNSVYNKVSALDKVAKKILSTIDPTYNDRMFLSSRSSRLRTIIDRELQISKGVSGGSIVDFVTMINTNNSKKKDNTQPSSNFATDLFTKNINDIFSYFQDINRNRFMEMADLKFISKFIPVLGEAVRTILDAIVSSDDQSETINRQITLPAEMSDNDKSIVIAEIERLEDEYKLRKKLKNTVYKKTLITGQFYVYAISYSELFEAYENKLREQQAMAPGKKNQFGSSIKPNNVLAREMKKLAKEAATNNETNEGKRHNNNDSDIQFDIVTESVKNILTSSPAIYKTSESLGNRLSDKEVTSIMEMFEEMLPKVKIDDSPVFHEALEGFSNIVQSNMLDLLSMHREVPSVIPNSDNTNTENIENASESHQTTTDSTKDIYDTNTKSKSKYSIPGVYIKYIDSRHVIPIKIFDKVVGYYVVHPSVRKGRTPVTGTDGFASIGNTIFNTVNVTERRKEEAVARIVDTITDGIIQHFSSKFVCNNAEYKKLIADCIIANGITDVDYNVQFIPAEYMYEFKINENDDGYGESVLSESLFPAKALLSVMVTRMLNFVNKTGNKTIAHIHKGPIDTYTANQIERIIRDLQDSDITFNDLLSPNLVFNKFNRDGRITIPTSKNGTRLVEFETQEGQNIDMSSEYENKLEAMAVLGTGVPNIIMDYTGSAEFAKQYVSANIKFAGRIASYQADLEETTTALYRKLIEHSTLSEQLKVQCSKGLYIKLPRPRVLVNGNNAEFLRTILETAGLIADTYLGQNNETNTELRNKLVKEIVKANSPYFDWNEIEAIYKRLEAESSKPKESNNKNDSSSF